MELLIGERSPQDPRPAKPRPVGTIERITADDGMVEVWRLDGVIAGEEAEDDKARAEARYAAILEELKALEDVDLEAVTKKAVDMEMAVMASMKRDLEAELEGLKKELD